MTATVYRVPGKGCDTGKIFEAFNALFTTIIIEENHTKSLFTIVYNQVKTCYVMPNANAKGQFHNLAYYGKHVFYVLTIPKV